jgi:hypothetical protein
MSTITRIIMEAERTSAMEFVRALMREEEMRAAMAAASQATLARKTAVLRQNPRHPDARPPDARSPGEGRPGSARDMDMSRPMAVGIGRAHPTGRPIRSAKSTIVPEPDQIKSKRPEPRYFAGRFEPRG